jgi:hypothetical protein
MRPAFQIIGVLIAIGALLALLALAFYVIWRITMVVVSFLPIIGKKHKHADWERLQT